MFLWRCSYILVWLQRSEFKNWSSYIKSDNKAISHKLAVSHNRRKKINITDYESLLEAAQQQDEPQRLLFVFLKVSLPKDHEGNEKSTFNSGQGGALQPVMCVDKTLEELDGFSELVKESEKMEQEWQIVLIASLCGRNGVMPDSDEAEHSLKMMVETVQQGGDLSKFMAFDKGGEPVQFNWNTNRLITTFNS